MRPLLFIALALLTACSSGQSTPIPADTPMPIVGTASPTGITEAFERPPYSDFADLVARYGGARAEPLTNAELYRVVPIGHRETFTLLSPNEPPSAYQVEAEVMYVGRHAIWYVERGLEPNVDAVKRAGDWFERMAFEDAKQRIAPDISLPGPIAIVAAKLRGGVTGYFTSLNTLPVETYAHSNERMAIAISPGREFDSQQTRGVLVHELQHLLHWLVDSTETGWVHEGLSEWLVLEQEIEAIPFSLYLRAPEVSLPHWPLEVGASLPNYAGASLFMRYMLNILAPDGDPSMLVRQQRDGIEGINQFMLEQGYDDYTFEQLYLDYATANAVGASSGKYAAPGHATATIRRVANAPGSVTGAAPQWAPWYLRVTPDHPFRVTFSGNTVVPVLHVAPHSGDYCWWSNAADLANATLTRAFDLRADKPTTLTFWHWYEIERFWDWGYVSVSTDGGATWTALEVDGTTVDNPIGTAIGPGFTGNSGEWARVEVDLSAYTGRQIHLRFEYITDEGRNGAGWCIDNITLQGQQDGAESESLWHADGFVRLHRAGVQQRYAVRVVEGTRDAPVVRDIQIEGAQAAFRVNGPAILIVVGMASPSMLPAEFLLILEALAPTSGA